jgi:E3 ubiquitin-protein ligase synoviolin
MSPLSEPRMFRLICLQMDTIPYPGADTLFHVRFLALFSFLWVLDAIMIAFAVESILTHGVGGIVLFGSEVGTLDFRRNSTKQNQYAILMANASQCLSKWAIFSYDQHRARQAGGEEAPVWENKTVYIFYVELVAGS